MPFFVVRPAPIYQVPRGHSVTIPCVAVGDPTPSIVWKKVLSHQHQLQITFRHCYSAPDRRAEYCDERVCLCVWLSVRDHIFGTTPPIFNHIFVHVTYGRGSVLRWLRSDTSCTSGFMDDVIFAHKPRLLYVTAQLKRSAHAALGLAIKCAQ